MLTIPVSKSQALALYDGRQSALAKALGVSRQAVHKLGDDKPIPELWAMKLRYELKPEAFGAAPTTEQKAA